MPVVQAEDATAIQPNHVYMIPPNKFISVKDGGLFLEKPIKHRGMRMPIDHFFRSLAEHRKERSIGVVLSGTGSDGTLGIKEIKAQGGMIMVQAPDSADYDGMPRSALSSGVVDFVCAIDEMPSTLVKNARHPYLDPGEDGAAALLETALDHFKSITNLLRAHTNYDFRFYKKGTLSRRIQRRMGLRHVEQITDYLNLLRNDNDEINLLFKDLLISVTAFFRETEAWSVLADEVIAKLVAKKKLEDPVRVWVPGCATGEEAYSLVMLLYEQFELQKKHLEVQLFATDMDEDAVDTARLGKYSASIAADLAPTRLKRFFQENDHGYRVNKRLRESCVFAVQNLVGDPPFSNLDIISCRNLLIYLEQDVQQKLMQMFHFSLRPGGYLFLGASESVGKSTKLFESVSSQWRIYRKWGTTRRGAANLPIIPAVDRTNGRGANEDENADTEPIGSVELARKTLLERFVPASVLIDRWFEVRYFHGPVRNYLDIPSGEPTIELTAMCLEGLRCKLRGTVHKALHENEAASVVAPRVRRNGETVAVRITVEPLPHRKGADPLLLISFVDEPKSMPSNAKTGKADDADGESPNTTWDEAERFVGAT